jgi:Bacterial PH domain
VDRFQNLKYDYTYKPPGSKAPAAGLEQSPIDGLLSSGEKVIWTGKPPRRLLMLNAGDLFLIPFFLFWTGFACFWEAMAIGGFLEGGMGGPGICMPLFGLPFVAIGLFMLGARFVGDALVRRSTFYALTDRRVMIVTGRNSQTLVSVPLDKIDNIGLTIHRNGTGTLNFAGGPNVAWLRGFTYNTGNTRNGQSSMPPFFDHIPDPKKVYDMVMKAQDDLTVRQHGYTPE